MKDDSCDDYDPHSYGKQEHPTIFWGSIFHLFKCTVGTGILSLPFVFKEVGYGVAIFGALLVGLINVHVLHLLLQVEYDLCKKLRIPNLTYVGVVQHTFEQGPSYVRRLTPMAKFMVYFHYVFNKSIANAVYLITIGGNFKIIIDHYCNTNISIVSVINASVVILIAMALIRNLKFLVPMSILTNVFNMINIVLIVTIPINYNGSADFKVITDITKFPYFFGLTLRAFNCTGIVIPLKNDLKHPKKFSKFFGVLNIALSAAVTLGGVFGVLGYFKFGDQVQPNVLLNLPPDRVASLVVLCLYSFSIFISFILTLYIAFDTLWSNIFKDWDMRYPLTTEYVLRIFLCLLPYVLAVALPDFKIMVGLAGVIGVLMDETVPIILHFLSLVQKEHKTLRVYVTLIKDLVLILICLSLFSAALIQVIQSIIQFYS